MGFSSTQMGSESIQMEQGSTHILGNTPMGLCSIHAMGSTQMGLGSTKMRIEEHPYPR